MPAQRHSQSPLPSSHPTASERSESKDSGSYRCSCGTGDGTGDYIKCDNEECRLAWYHWECVGVMEAPVGMWLCPSCSPSAACYIQQLVTKRNPSPLVGKADKTDKTGVSKRKKQEQNPASKTKKKEPAKKGVATKNPAATKPKPKWIGWVEVSSEGEVEFKEKVDAQWTVEEGLVGKRRKASKAVDEENEIDLRGLRPRSVPERRVNKAEEKDTYEDNEDEDTQVDSGESDYHEGGEEEVPVHRREPMIEMSDDSHGSKDSMDVEDQEPTSTERHNSDDFPPSDSKEARRLYPGLVQDKFVSGMQANSNVSKVEVENSEGFIDTGDRDASCDASGSDTSDGSEYMADDDASVSSPQYVTASEGREIAHLQSSGPVAAPATDLASTLAVSPILQVSEPALRCEDIIDVGADSEEHEEQEVVVVFPAVESNSYAALYQRQGSSWGVFPQSAIRSTLPRLS